MAETRTGRRGKAPARRGRERDRAEEEQPEPADDEEEPEPADDEEEEPEPADEEEEPEPADDEEEEPEPADDEEEEPEPADEEEESADGRRSSRLTAGQAARAALRQIVELTAKKAEGITGVEPADDGWVVGIEVVEDRRIPSSGDILAIYETTVDEDGQLLSYRRVRRYSRGRGDSDGGP